MKKTYDGYEVERVRSADDLGVLRDEVLLELGRTS